MLQKINLRAAVFDLDGTLCRQDSFKKYLRIKLFRRPRHWIKLFPVLWWMLLTYVFKINSNNWLKKKAIGLICKGITQEEASDDANLLIRNLNWNQQLLAILDQCRQNGVTTVLATASPQIYVDAINDHFGIDHVLSTRMELDASGIWTGRVLGENCYGKEKKNQLSAWCQQNALDWQNLVLFSDSVADLPSFQHVGLAVAVQPTWRLKQSMARHGIIPMSDAVARFKELDKPLLQK